MKVHRIEVKKKKGSSIARTASIGVTFQIREYNTLACALLYQFDAICLQRRPRESQLTPTRCTIVAESRPRLRDLPF